MFGKIRWIIFNVPLQLLPKALIIRQVALAVDIRSYIDSLILGA
jgi:ABC-type uncharacterized transport system YnjBCD permease subunit